jgi:hypothetical protein
MRSFRTNRASDGLATVLVALFAVTLFAAFMTMTFAWPSNASAQTRPATSDANITKAVGTIKSVQPGSIIVAAESGGDITATLAPTTKILRVPPGEKDLKNATALQPQDLQPGDRVLVRGQATSDPHSISALSVIVMKQADVSAKHQRESDDWQKRGVGGLVTNVDAANGTITISSGGLGTSRNVALHVGKDTILRRYAPGSVKFDDAKPAPLAEIKIGDQLRARGTRSPDGNELTAEEVVSGSFRNIAGTITAIDAANNTITVHDLIAKASVVVKISSDSQMKKLPAEMAQRVAMRLKGGASGDQNADSQNPSPQNGSASNSQSKQSPSSDRAQNGPDAHAGASAGAQGRGGPPDVQRMLSRLPNSSLADLQKGDAVMIVSSSGQTSANNSGDVTAITLLAGVEPILTAAPSRSASLLSPWSLSTSGGEGDSAP